MSRSIDRGITGRSIEEVRAQIAADRARFGPDLEGILEREAVMSVDNLALLEHSIFGGSERIPHVPVPVTSDMLSGLFGQNPDLITTPIGILKYPRPFDPNVRTAQLDRINTLRTKRNGLPGVGETTLFKRATYSNQQFTYFDELLEERRLKLSLGSIGESGTISGLSFSVLDRKTGEEADASHIYVAQLEVRSAFTEILALPRIEHNRIVLDIRPQQGNNTLHAA